MANAKKLRLACELAADRVVAARAGEGGTVDLTSVRTLGSGALAPNLSAANINMREVVRTAVQEALAAVASRGHDLIMVLPDATCRVALLDFDTLPQSHEDTDAVVRFRLKKSLPFDVDHARVSYHLQRGDDGKLSVIAAVALASVVEEYEAVVRDAGYSPGIVLPSMLAALGQVDASVPTLVIKVDPLTTGVAIVHRGRLVLTRTLDNPAGSYPLPTQLAEDIYPSIVFFQDTYGTKVQKILVGGLTSLDQVNLVLEEQSGIRAQELVSTSRIGGGSSQRIVLSGVVGALAEQA